MATVLVSAGLFATTAAATTAITSTAISVGLGLVQRAIMPDQIIKQQGARLTESQITSSTEGAPIPRITARMRVGGQMFWATTFRETSTLTSDISGGKGGPRSGSETESFIYDASFAVGLCEADGDVTMGRVWADGQLLDLENITLRFYDGASDQMPDPKMEAVEGPGRVPAYRGTCYILFEDFDLTDFGNRLPQITVEVIRTPATVAPTRMEGALRGVTIGPGVGEFALATTPYSQDAGDGNSTTINSHSSTGDTDLITSLDRLGDYLQQVDSASLVVSWFGTSMDATACDIVPKVADDVTLTVPESWQVGTIIRSTAQVVQYQTEGTPSDVSVLEAVTEMKDRGLRVMFHPVVQMDVEGTPWRGEIAGTPTYLIAQHRDYVLHYANLLSADLEAGDAFLIGSEMVTLSQSAEWGAAMVALMAEVRAILPAGVLVSYAAHWTEYKEAALTDVWNAADFIGVDYFAPLTDWRDATDEDYTLAAFKAGITSGEEWDYRYVDREVGTTVTITDPLDRQKDIVSWRDATHPGAELWFTAFGCQAVDKGANADLTFSDGTRNDTVQRLYIEAMLDYWGADNMFVWTWDARPYPAYPTRDDVWSDTDVWRTGYSIVGRVGTVTLDSVVRELCIRIGYADDEMDTTRLSDLPVQLRGVYVGDLTSPRAVLENLMATYLFDCYEVGNKLLFVSRKDPIRGTVDADDFIMQGRGGDTYRRTRAQDTTLPDRVKVDFLDESRDYQSGSVDGHTVTGNSRRVEAFSTVAVISDAYARGLADALVNERWIARDTIAFSVPFGSPISGMEYLSLRPGVVFPFLDSEFRVTRRTIGDQIDIEAIAFSADTYDVVEHASSAPTSDQVASFGRSLVEFAELPVLTADAPNLSSPRIIGRQYPWPGAINIYRYGLVAVRESEGLDYQLSTSLMMTSVMGETVTDLPAGVPWKWDNASSVTVRLYSDSESLVPKSEFDVLNGANRLAILTPSGEWEVLQFANVTLNVDGTFTLSKMLRGQLGTEPFIGNPTPAGSKVVGYDPARWSTFGGVTPFGDVSTVRYGPDGVPVTDVRYQQDVITSRGVAYRPWAPCQLRQRKEDNGDLTLTWIRRTRFDGDSWETTEVPLHEEFEQYNVQVIGGRSAVRDDTTSYTYSLAAQVADFGSGQDSVEWTVQQVSTIFGPGATAYG